jgi:WhiB family redox-sensing transcriptional regulator
MEAILRSTSCEDVRWRAEAACRERSVGLFFPEQGEPSSARRVCVRCPVRRACLEYALVTGQEHGVWGGSTARERNLIRRGALSIEDLLARPIRPRRPRRSRRRPPEAQLAS